MITRTLTACAGATLIAALLALGTALPGPSDIEAAQDVAADRHEASQAASTQFNRDSADCRAYYGPHAELRMLDGMHLVCRPPRAVGTTTAQVQP